MSDDDKVSSPYKLGNNCSLLESLGLVKPLAGRTTGVNG